MISTLHEMHYFHHLVIQFCNNIGLRINPEGATIYIIGRAVNDFVFSHDTVSPLIPNIITEVRSDVSDEFIDRVEFDYFVSMPRNAINGTVNSGHRPDLFTVSFSLPANKS